VIMVHEQDPAKGACPFDRFMHVTPADLVMGGIYGSMAVPAYPGPHESVTFIELYKTMGMHYWKSTSSGSLLGIREYIKRQTVRLAADSSVSRTLRNSVSVKSCSSKDREANVAPCAIAEEDVTQSRAAGSMVSLSVDAERSSPPPPAASLAAGGSTGSIASNSTEESERPHFACRSTSEIGVRVTAAEPSSTEMAATSRTLPAVAATDSVLRLASIPSESNTCLKTDPMDTRSSEKVAPL